MASQTSDFTCETLSEDEILTESTSEDDLGRVKTLCFDTTRDQRIMIKTALKFKIP
jgi:hypothetical protein